MPPLRNYPHLTLFAEDFNYRKDYTGNVIVEIAALYGNGDTGKLVYVFGKDRRIKVNYEITVAAKEIRPRQYGL
jgi:hypothetical protein